MSEFTVSSILADEPAEVWRHATSPSGVNRELRPVLRAVFRAVFAWRHRKLRSIFGTAGRTGESGDA